MRPLNQCMSFFIPCVWEHTQFTWWWLHSHTQFFFHWFEWMPVSISVRYNLLWFFSISVWQRLAHLSSYLSPLVCSRRRIYDMWIPMFDVSGYHDTLDSGCSRIPLYFLQGMPYGIQVKFLPILLRANGVSLTNISLFKLLFLPWVFKVSKI